MIYFCISKYFTLHQARCECGRGSARNVSRNLPVPHAARSAPPHNWLTVVVFSFWVIELTKNSFLEGTRLSSTVGLYRDVVRSCKVDDHGTVVPLEAGRRVFCNLMSASRDPAVFPEPNKVDLTRPLDSYIHYGAGPRECLGKGLSWTGLTRMLKTVGRLKNLRRAPGPQGEIKKIAGPYGVTLYMTEDQRSYFPFPTTMKINWDGDLPPLTT